MSFDDEISIEGMVGGANRGPIDDEVAAKPTFQIGDANQGLVDDAMTPDDGDLQHELNKVSASEFAGTPSESANEGASEGASQSASQPAEKRKSKLSLSLRRKPKQ